MPAPIPRPAPASTRPRGNPISPSSIERPAAVRPAALLGAPRRERGREEWILAAPMPVPAASEDAARYATLPARLLASPASPASAAAPTSALPGSGA